MSCPVIDSTQVHHSEMQVGSWELISKAKGAQKDIRLVPAEDKTISCRWYVKKKKKKSPSIFNRN